MFSKIQSPLPSSGILIQKTISSFLCLQILLQVSSSYKRDWASLILQITLCQPCLTSSQQPLSPFPLKKSNWSSFLSFTPLGSHSPSLYWWQKAPNTSNLSGLSLDLSPGFGLSLWLCVALLTTPWLNACLLLPSWMLLYCCPLPLLNVPSASFTSSSSWPWNLVPQGMGLGSLLQGPSGWSHLKMC